MKLECVLIPGENSKLSTQLLSGDSLPIIIIIAHLKAVTVEICKQWSSMPHC